MQPVHPAAWRVGAKVASILNVKQRVLHPGFVPLNTPLSAADTKAARSASQTDYQRTTTMAVLSAHLA